MGACVTQRNTEDGTITILQADDEVEVADELLQNVDPSVGHIVLHIGDVAYRLSDYNPTAKTYQGVRVR